MAGLEIINRVKRKWQFIRVANAILASLGILIIAYFLAIYQNKGQELELVALLTIPSIIAGLLIFRPWKVTDQNSAKWIDSQLSESQNSAYLLIQPISELTSLGIIQQKRVSNYLASYAHKLGWPQSIKPGIVYLLLGLSIGLIINILPPSNQERATQIINTPIEFVASDSLKESETPLSIIEQKVTINYPAYTGVKSAFTADMNIQALENSVLQWRLKFSEEPKSLKLIMLSGKSYSFENKDGQFILSLKLSGNSFYKFVYENRQGDQFESELYSMEAYPDLPPTAEIGGLEQFTLLEIDDNKKISFSSVLTDDYGLASAAIIATVSKGSGESVKFREERMKFDSPLKKGSNRAQLTKHIDLEKLKMTPGDELYFYVEVYDTKQPKQNRSRTDTYFVSIRDTTEIQFSLAGALGVDLMPEYFRSQRQIIIDTEKLIKTRGKGKKHDFNSTSNELGFDQKSLRLKYGQFMGEEFETGITESAVPEESAEDHDHDDSEENLLEKYSHAHDTENEHNLVSEEKEEDPLEQYTHAHDDPEEATLYTKSIKGKLRAAMNEMWDAELYLRLYEPEKSLPYQYRALKLIKEIKNHARIYVHRIGFDPPPIKEDTRLTGKLDRVENTVLTSETRNEQEYPYISKAILYIDSLLNNEPFTTYKTSIFQQAGTELAVLAIEKPGSYLITLQTLQNLNLKKVSTSDLRSILTDLQYQLSKAVPVQKALLTKEVNSQDALTEEFLNEIERSIYE